MSQIKFYFTRNKYVGLFKDLNTTFHCDPTQFYSKEKSTVEMMLNDLDSFLLENTTELLKILEIEHDKSKVEERRLICKHELGKLKLSSIEEIGIYTISTLLLSYFTQLNHFHSTYFIPPHIDIQILGHSAAVDNFISSILQGEYFCNDEELNVYTDDDAIEKYYCLNSIHRKDFEELILISSAQINPVAHTMLTHLLLNSDTLIIKVEDD